MAQDENKIFYNFREIDDTLGMMRSVASKANQLGLEGKRLEELKIKQELGRGITFGFELSDSIQIK